MAKSLFETLVRDLPAGYHGVVVNEDELRAMVWKSVVRDLASLGIRGPLANSIVRRTLAALKRTLESEEVSHEDKQAICLVSERVVMAVASVMLGAYLAAEDNTETLQSNLPPILD